MTRIRVPVTHRRTCEWCGGPLPERHKVTMRLCSSTCRARKAKWRKASERLWAAVAASTGRGFDHARHDPSEPSGGTW